MEADSGSVWESLEVGLESLVLRGFWVRSDLVRLVFKMIRLAPLRQTEPGEPARMQCNSPGKSQVLNTHRGSRNGNEGANLRAV